MVLNDPTPPDAPVAQHFNAAVLYADVSGFTPLTETLAMKGSLGAEQMTQLLNEYYSQMITLAESEGGEVVKFSGDGLTILFPEADEPLGYALRRAWQAAEAMQRATHAFEGTQHILEGARLGLKIGIGAGAVMGMRVGGVLNRWEYVLTGEPLRQAAAAEGRAESGDILLSPEARQLIHPSRLPPRPYRPPVWEQIENSQAITESLQRCLPAAVSGWLNQTLRSWMAELRPMSVVFIGLKDFDTLANEVNVARFQQFLEAAQHVIYRHEGSINKMAIDDKGTVFLVLFGAPPLAHEDDAARATRCALELQALSARQTLEIAIGVTSGWVFAGPVGSDTRREYTVMGDAVNLAARLMKQAGNGGILCDFDTYQQARKQIDFENLLPIRVKGKASMIRVYRPLGEVGMQMPDPGGELIGRVAETRLLAEVITALQRGESQILVFDGETGIGKSRLILEIGRLAQKSGLAGLLTYCHSIEQQTPYYPWRSILISYFGLEQIPQPARQRAYIERFAREMLPSQVDLLPLLNDILNIGLPESEFTQNLNPTLRPQNLARLITELLRLWSVERPMLLVFEDVHWMDAPSWSLLLQISRSLLLLRVPMLLALTMRPMPANTHSAQQLSLLAELPHTHRATLEPLDDEEIIELIMRRLSVHPGGLPESIGKLIQQRAGGNPLFALELVYTLRDQNVLHIETNPQFLGTPTPQRCTLIGNLQQAAQMLPDTVQGLLLARIDRLPPESQIALKIASVIGRSVPLGALTFVMQREFKFSTAQIETALKPLSLLGLTRTTAPTAEPTLVFQHILTQEVTYQTLLFSQRRQLHQRVAQWYEETFANDERALAAYYPLLVHHYHQAENPAQEAKFAKLAAQQAEQTFANREALQYYARALELTERTHLAQRFSLLLAHERLCDLTGDRKTQRRDLDTLQELADRLNDLNQRAEVTLRQANLAQNTGDYTTALELSRRATEQLRVSGSWELLVKAYLGSGRALIRLGRYEEARSVLEYSAQVAKNHHFPQLEADAHRNLGAIEFYTGNYLEARQTYLHTLKLYRDLNDQQGQVAILNNLGAISRNLGEYEAAQTYFEQGIEGSQRIGDRRSEVVMRNNYGIFALHQHHILEARHHFQQALHSAREIGDRWNEAWSLLNLGGAEHRSGELDTAGSHYQISLDLSQQTGDRHGEALALANHALLRLHQNQLAEANRLALQALEITTTLGDRPIEADVLHKLGLIALAQNHFEQASGFLQRALEIRKETGEQNLAFESRAALLQTQLAQHSINLTDLQTYLNPLKNALQFPPPGGLDEPLRPTWVVLQGLLMLQQPNEARSLHAQALRWLQHQAEAFTLPHARAAFLENLPLHRALQHFTLP
ncbi:MAG: adenylate/guanylate cyclase domain-containing protein [Anaerolineales bacterium]